MLLFLHKQNDVISCAQQVEMLEQQLAARMEQLQATVQSKTAVPTAQVYVSYIITSMLCKFFSSQQHNVCRLAQIERVCRGQSQHVSVDTIFSSIG